MAYAKLPAQKILTLRMARNLTDAIPERARGHPGIRMPIFARQARTGSRLNFIETFV